MKRYSVIDVMKTTINGTETYYRRDDLIAAGVLVPVPVGEACDLDDVSTDVWVVVFHENLCYREEDGYSWATFSDTAKPRFLQSLSFVQPVRLMTLE